MLLPPPACPHQLHTSPRPGLAAARANRLCRVPRSAPAAGCGHDDRRGVAAAGGGARAVRGGAAVLVWPGQLCRQRAASRAPSTCPPSALVATSRMCSTGFWKTGFRWIIVGVHHQGLDGPESLAIRQAAAEVTFEQTHAERGDAWWGKAPLDQADNVFERIQVWPSVLPPAAAPGRRDGRPRRLLRNVADHGRPSGAVVDLSQLAADAPWYTNTPTSQATRCQRRSRASGMWTLWSTLGLRTPMASLRIALITSLGSTPTQRGQSVFGQQGEVDDSDSLPAQADHPIAGHTRR